MTNFEAAQNRQVFFEAGKTAFRMGILASANPYPLNHRSSESWAAGYRVARDLDWRQGAGRKKPVFKPKVKRSPHREAR